MGHIAANFSQDMGVPLVFTFHSRYDLYAQKYVPLVSNLAGMLTDEVVRRYLDKCTHVIAPTDSIRDFILQEYDVGVPVSVVPTPVDLSGYGDLHPQRIRAALGLEGAEVLLYVGRLSEEKNLDFLLRAFSLIARECPRVRLLLVGKGPQAYNLKLLAQKMGIENRVLFVGAVPHEKVPHYAAMADLCVFSSPADTQGLVLIEAMAAATPVVAVDALGPVDVLAEGGGVLAPPVEHVFARAVVTLLSNDERRRELGAQAVRSAQRYAIPAAVTRLLLVYEAAISAGPRCVKKDLSETWHEIGDQFRAIGAGLSAVFNTSRESEDAPRYWSAGGSRPFSLIDEMGLVLLAEVEKKRFES